MLVVSRAVVHSFTNAAPVLSLALSPDDAHLFTGMANGLLCMRHRAKTAAPLHMTNLVTGGHRPGSIEAAIAAVNGGAASGGARAKSTKARRGDAASAHLTSQRLRTGTYRYLRVPNTQRE